MVNSHAYKYWRDLILDKEGGISPVNMLFERSSVCSLDNFPSSNGSGPKIRLFCNNLHYVLVPLAVRLVHRHVPIYTCNFSTYTV